jgi:periplasmic mercuric ion binding protein
LVLEIRRPGRETTPSRLEIMSKAKIINYALVLAAITLLVVCALSVRFRPVADSVAILSTTGMTCGGCSADIDTALQGKNGVAAVEVDVERGQVVVGYNSKKIGPDELAATVTTAGYGSRIAQVLNARQFRSMTGRNPGEVRTGRTGCGCGSSTQS